MNPATGIGGRQRGRQRRDDAGDPPSGIVAIVGRPNVGKSTLFNRLTGTRRAIVDEMAGLTRDRLYGVVEWRNRTFTLVDTAGLDPRPAGDGPDDMSALIRGTQAQARMAIAEADLILLMLDVRDGVTSLDDEIVAMVRAGGKPVVLVGNKADSDREFVLRARAAPPRAGRAGADQRAAGNRHGRPARCDRRYAPSGFARACAGDLG